MQGGFQAYCGNYEMNKKNKVAEKCGSERQKRNNAIASRLTEQSYLIAS
jgi:hypothetical protein